MRTSPRHSLPAHGGQLRQIAARYGVRAEQLLDFSANINPDGPPTRVIAALQQKLNDPSYLTSYPDLELAELKDTLARDANVRPQEIAVANGFVPLLEAAVRSLKITRCLMPVPSFREYRQTLANNSVAVAPYHLSHKDDFVYEPQTLLEHSLKEGCDAILLANPQNPSGLLTDASKMFHLVKLAGQNGIKVLLDEAFIDYAPTHSITQFAVERPNLIVFRSVTKFFAIPGLRVAYAVSDAASIQTMNRAIAPWPISSFASDAVCAAVQDSVYAANARSENERRRKWLGQKLAGLKIHTYPSMTNFLLLRFATKVDVDLLWERMILEEQIVLRSCANFEGLAAGHLRVAVGADPENQKLIFSLERVICDLATRLS